VSGFVLTRVKSYALDEAHKNGINLPITEIVNQFYEEIQTMEGGRWDTSSLLKRLRLL